MISLFIAIGGIVILALVARSLGLTHDCTFEDETSALQHLQHRHAGFRVARSYLSTDKKTALFEDQAQLHLGIAFSLGDDVVTRIIDKGSITAITPLPEKGGTQGVILQLADMSCPEVRIPMRDAAQTEWYPRLQSYLGERA